MLRYTFRLRFNKPSDVAASFAGTSTVATKLYSGSNSWESLKGAHDICFYYPRYNISTHLVPAASSSSAGGLLPELTQVQKALHESDAAGDTVETLRYKVTGLLSRANEVFMNACPAETGGLLASSGAAPSLRKHAVAVAAALAATENNQGRNRFNDFKLCATLAPAVRAIGLDSSIYEQSVEGFDCACFVLSAYTKAMTNQLMRGEWSNIRQLSQLTGIKPPTPAFSSSSSSSTSSVEETEDCFLPTPLEVQNAVESLRVACILYARRFTTKEDEIISRTQGKMGGGMFLDTISLADENIQQGSEDDYEGGDGGSKSTPAKSFRSTYNKLTALSALLQLQHNNDCSAANEMLTPLLRLKGSTEVEKRLVENIRVEILRRSYGHAWGPEAIDSEVEAAYLRLQEFFTQFFEPDGPDGAVSMPEKELVVMRDAFSMMQLSIASMYQEMPRKKSSSSQRGKAAVVEEPSFEPNTRLSLSPFVHCPAAPKTETQRKKNDYDIVNFKSTSVLIPCSATRAKKLATIYSDRSLKINRKIFPDNRNNARSAAALRSLAICFTDVRDYLYAEGMFNSALRTYEILYGKLSEEYLEVLALSHQMQKVLKNDKEADATGHLLAKLREEFESKK